MNKYFVLYNFFLFSNMLGSCS